MVQRPRLELEDHQGLVHFPDGCHFVLDTNNPDFNKYYQALLERRDDLFTAKTKFFWESVCLSKHLITTQSS